MSIDTITLAACGALIWALLCRARLMHPGTHRPQVRYAFAALAAATAAMAVVPLVRPQARDICELALVLATLGVQWAMAREWKT